MRIATGWHRPRGHRSLTMGQIGMDGDDEWMRDVLALLVDDDTEQAAARLMRDDGAREAVKPLLARSLAGRGVRAALPLGQTGDNLLLALRARFPRDEAMEKVELNIAMRRRAGIIAGNAGGHRQGQGQGQGQD